THIRMRPLLPAVYGGIAHFLRQHAKRQGTAELHRTRNLLTGVLRSGVVAPSPAGFLKEELFVLVMEQLALQDLNFGDKHCLPSAPDREPLKLKFHHVMHVPNFKATSDTSTLFEIIQDHELRVLCIPQASDERWVDLVVYDFKKREVIAFQVC